MSCCEWNASRGYSEQNGNSRSQQNTTIKSLCLLQVYDLNTVAKDIELPGAFILGAGAASSRILGVNAEVSNKKHDSSQWIHGSIKTVEHCHARCFPIYNKMII